MIPRATYRLQFHKAFPFAAAAPLAPYLQRLGISHVYCSPILKARPGSIHGYDVIDNALINPELGGEEGFRGLAAELRARGVGLIVDIVPNHMAVDEGNRWWWDVLEKGRESRFSSFFDIDWDMLDGKVLLAVLGKTYWETLQAGQLKLVRSELGKTELRYFDRRFPLRPADQDVDPAEYSSREALDSLIRQQGYRLAWWRMANDAINWRRFFDVPDLVALRQDAEGVFEATHAKVFELYADGLIDGVRVDHIDGLADPAAYCQRLRARLADLGMQRHPPDDHPYIVVEKILGPGEELPSRWAVDGTTGYDFMNEVSALQHAAAGAEPLARLWHAISGRPPEFGPEETQARGEITQSSFESALSRTAEAFFALAQQNIASKDISGPAIRRALVRILQHLRVYRTYATGGHDSPAAGSHFEAAAAASKSEAGEGDRAAIDWIGTVLQGTAGASPINRADAVRRFNQLAAPVAAKSVEDTAFYRYGRLLSRNDVGFNPGSFSLPISEFHDRMAARAASFPHALLATATHDHKRGEDMRARLAVLSEIPEPWERFIAESASLNLPHRPAELTPADEYQLYQTLVGAWPFDLLPDDAEGLRIYGERIAKWQEKALREEKLCSSWLDPDTGYEEKARTFLRTVLNPGRSSDFLHALHGFVQQIAPAGALNGLVQTTLRCTAPGVPDCYQGSEFWDFSLVDPDNRRPVDYTARSAALDAAASIVSLLENWQSGHVKQRLIAALLRFRQQNPALFDQGSYEPLAVGGGGSHHLLAFLRRWQEQALVVAVPLQVAAACSALPRPEGLDWDSTFASLPSDLAVHDWTDLLTGSRACFADGYIGAAKAFRQFPIAVFASDYAEAA